MIGFEIKQCFPNDQMWHISIRGAQEWISWPLGCPLAHILSPKILELGTFVAPDGGENFKFAIYYKKWRFYIEQHIFQFDMK